MNRFLTTLAALALAGPAFAEGHASGDAAEGERVFNQCKSCHMIVSDDGENIVRGGRTGPNMYGLIGRVPGSVEDFRYGDSLAATGEIFPDGWNEEMFVAYVQDPQSWLRETLDDSKARSKMSYKLRSEEDAANVWAYIVSVGPEPEAAATN